MRAERKDRGDFIRTFMRRYQGFRVATCAAPRRGQLRAGAAAPGVPAALERIAAHRAAGTARSSSRGPSTCFVEPLREFFDEVVAGTMHERDGVLTGYLADPPLVDESRAAWLAALAEQGGFDLASHGYGDSHADLVWLQLTGNPNVVNPDVPLLPPRPHEALARERVAGGLRHS